jgi:hypothetical protein
LHISIQEQKKRENHNADVKLKYQKAIYKSELKQLEGLKKESLLFLSLVESSSRKQIKNPIKKRF